MRILIVLLLSLMTFAACEAPQQSKAQGVPQSKADFRNRYYSRTDTTALVLPDSVWRRVLPDSLYEVARNKETQQAFTGKYWNYTGLGTYFCAACGNALFRSDAKFASTCGWPSFFETLRVTAVQYVADNSYGMERTEVLCGRCGSHLGHLFDDGPPPSGKRYCMNSVSLDFEPDKK